MENVVSEDSCAQINFYCSESGSGSWQLGCTALGKGSHLELAAFRRVFGNCLFEVGRQD
jgi:hypothetical protein